jgi:hypothetical protein
MRQEAVVVCLKGRVQPPLRTISFTEFRDTFFRDHKFYSYDVYKHCCWLLFVFSDFTSRYILNSFAKGQLQRAINYVSAKHHSYSVCCA